MLRVFLSAAGCGRSRTRRARSRRTPAVARETRPLADRFSVEIGFINEPAIQADTNGIWLRVTEGEEPVTGMEQTLQAEVIFGDRTVMSYLLYPIVRSLDEALRSP